VKVYYANDTKFHAGSDAVSEAILKRLTDQGHEIIGRCYRPYGPETNVMLQADALVVNGEGTFRDEKRAWEPGRIAALMDGMRRAKDAGLRVHFINATWCNMQPHWKSILEQCDELAVQEVISAREMQQTMGLSPSVYLDASYYANDVARPVSNMQGQVVMGKLYPHNFSDHLSEFAPCFPRTPYLPILPEGKGFRWAEIVSTLRGASLYITGQHHGVYAAAKARVPFVPCKCNTHKVEGLLEWAGAEDIPIVRRLEDVEHCIAWAMQNTHRYEELYSWMDEQPWWPGIQA
jgi:hypothetical protein